MNRPDVVEVPDGLILADFGTARWDVVDAHRCTECGYLDTDGRSLMSHLWTHVPFACHPQTPAAEDGRCRQCGWQGPGTHGPPIDVGAEHHRHLIHSAYVRTLCHPRCSGAGLHYFECVRLAHLARPTDAQEAP